MKVSEKEISIKKGDIFFTQGRGFVSRSIMAITRFWSEDGEARYSHVGIFLNEHGTTVEALPDGIKSKSFISEYKGLNVLIVRPLQEQTMLDFALANVMKEHYGEVYPFWRLPLFALGPLARVCVSDRLVCSEFVAKCLHLAGLRHSRFKGTTPDELADEARNYRTYEVIAEGRLTA